MNIIKYFLPINKKSFIMPKQFQNAKNIKNKILNDNKKIDKSYNNIKIFRRWNKLFNCKKICTNIW